MLLKQSRVHWSHWIVILICLIIPLVTDHMQLVPGDLMWMLYIIPAIILAYYYGLKGGFITAFFSVSIQLTYKLSERNFNFMGLKEGSDGVVLVTLSLGLFATAIGMGILADRLKLKQNELEVALRTMKSMAYHDELSSLPNRRKFIDKLSELINDNPYPRMIAIMFIDLDRFKMVNDTFGHAAGDLLIIEVAKQLAKCVSEESLVARMGGDEFTILIDKVTSVDEVEEIAQTIIECFEKPLNIQGREIQVNLSIGIVLYPHNGLSMEVLLEHADAAMYLDKQREGSHYRFYSKEIDTRIFRKLEIKNQLEFALGRDEFTLSYQPQVIAKTQQIVGVEALIRWKNNKLGLITPTEFIPIAEEAGIIIPIGEWVLETACRDAKTWFNKGLPQLRLSVNISPIQLIHDQFEEMVNRVLKQTGFPPENLELEITENVGLYGLDKSLTTLQRLRAMGIGLAIDDFGTGYSSLSYLVDLPIDTIKIDRVFVQNLNTNSKLMTLAEAIIKISKVMNFQTIGEGVETLEELKGLDTLECDQIQGYFFSKPVSTEIMAELLKNGISVETDLRNEDIGA
ncbi:phytochrome-like protein cph2 [Desulfosporosinus acididurans]|uniref:Phytochrome-like protein cph2 n=1 Tax=Desulfosporosinus acididurans TaxID=476652 RepID=A0A0J1IGF9_9FIRM|nr:EAL domain-containing protein [Desulfosporosinus acididurans]KLU63811.1 phytochrome-like protein cph2 [Desulfosporosinus acididurans]